MNGGMMMNDGGDMAEGNATTTKTPVAAQDIVPLSALNLPDDQEQMQNPEVGDKVQYTVEGTVDRIEGDTAVVLRESINGQPIPHPEPDQDEFGGPPDRDMDDLQRMAQNTSLY